MTTVVGKLQHRTWHNVKRQLLLSWNPSVRLHAGEGLGLGPTMICITGALPPSSGAAVLCHSAIGG